MFPIVIHFKYPKDFQCLVKMHVFIVVFSPWHKKPLFSLKCDFSIQYDVILVPKRKCIIPPFLRLKWVFLIWLTNIWCINIILFFSNCCKNYIKLCIYNNHIILCSLNITWLKKRLNFKRCQNCELHFRHIGST